MAAIQRALVDSSGNIAVHGRASAIITVKFGTTTPGVYRDISADALFFEVSGRFRVALAPGADIYTRQIIVSQANIETLPLGDEGTPFDLINETPEYPGVPWSGMLEVFGFRVEPPGPDGTPGTTLPPSGATVIVETIAGVPTIVVQDPAAYDAGEQVKAEIIALGIAVEAAISEAGAVAIADVGAAGVTAVGTVNAASVAGVAAIVVQQVASVQAVQDSQAAVIAAIVAQQGTSIAAVQAAQTDAITAVNAARDTAIAAVLASATDAAVVAVAQVVAQQGTSVAAVQAAQTTAVAALAAAFAANFYADYAAFVAAALPAGSYGMIAGGTGLFGTLVVATSGSPFYAIVSTWASGQVTIDTFLYVKALLGADTTIAPLITDTYGPTSLTSGSNSAANNSYGPAVTITDPFLLTEIGVWLQTAGAVEFRHRRAEVDVSGNLTGLDTFDYAVTLTPTAGTGVKTFGYADGLPQILVIPKDTILLKMTTGKAAVITGTGITQRRTAGVDSTTVGQTGLATVSTNTGEQVQMYFRGVRVASGQSVDARLDALEVKNPRQPGEMHNSAITLYREFFRSGTGFPSGWTAGGWTPSTSGAVAPASPGWGAILSSGVAQCFKKLQLRERFILNDAAAIGGIITSAIEAGNANGGAYIFDGPAGNLKIYSVGTAGATGVLRGTSAAFASAPVVGRKYDLAVDIDLFSTTVTLMDVLTQAVLVSYTLTMLVANDAGSRARGTGTPGYVYLSGSTGGMTITRGTVTALGSAAGVVAFLGDSNTEGSTLGPNYRNTYANRIARARGNDGSVYISARGGDESANLSLRIPGSIQIARPQYVSTNIGTNDGNAVTWFTNLTTNILPAVRRQGAVPIVCTVIPRTGVGSADQIKNNAINAYILAGLLGSDVIVVDLAAAVSLGNDRETPNPAYYENPATDFYTHMNNAGHAVAETQFRVDAAGLFVRSVPLIPVLVPVSISGKSLVSEVFPRFPMPSWTPAPTSDQLAASALVAATSTATYTLAQGGVTFGTVVFSAGQTTGTVTIAATTVLAAGVLTVTAPSPADATLSGVSFNLAGYR